MSDVLKDVSNGLAGLVGAADPTVVRVEGRRRLPATGIVWSSDGVIVTAHHVLERDEDLAIGLPGEDSAPAELVGRDPTTDLAVLRAEAEGLQTPTWAAPDSPKVGHLVLALGRPGKRLQATLGIVSALGDRWQTPAGGEVDRYLQTDVVMYPGFSGGPLIDVSGDLLGMNTSALRGVSVALPSETLKRVVESLLVHGRVRRGYLGVGLQPVRLPEALARKLKQETGLLLISVEPDSPAETAGLMLGDTIVSFGGESVRHMDSLLKALTGERIGVEAEVRVVRGGKLNTLKVVVGERA